MIIDSHFHLDLMNNMQLLIRELRSFDIGVIAVGTTPKAYEKEKQFCSGVSNIEVGLGLHPQLIGHREHEVDLFLRLVKSTGYIGEIGMDFNTPYIEFKDKQITCFRKIVNACAKNGGKILSIHSVKAGNTILDELENAGIFRTCKCIFHWFTGTIPELKRAINNGAYFSINPRMLNTKSGKEVIRLIPANRLLIETDAPFTFSPSSVSALKLELHRLMEGISLIRNADVSKLIEENNLQIWGKV